MLIYNRKEAISVMNSLGASKTPFVFLVDFEMRKIIISTDLDDSQALKFDMNGRTNHQPIAPTIQSYFFEAFPIPKSDYKEKFDLVKAEIQRGNSFLLNLACKTKVVTNLTLNDIYASTEAKYKVVLDGKFVCFSPEIFVQIRNGRIASYPMKGTIDADIPNAEEIILADKKELAEHYTIVDLIRNDLSRVAKKVSVDRFRYIDRIATSKNNLLQVSSEISGILPADYTSNIGKILFELLPAGSISGAPKVKTIQIIQEAEGQERGYYTGICGYFDGQNLDSGVMIRFLEQDTDSLYYRSGGGVTSMSDMDTEYKEMIDKIYLPISSVVQRTSTDQHFAGNEC